MIIPHVCHVQKIFIAIMQSFEVPQFDTSLIEIFCHDIFTFLLLGFLENNKTKLLNEAVRNNSQI